MISREAKPFQQLLDETLKLLERDFMELQMTEQVAHLSRIVRRGTSAHRQLELYHAIRKTGRAPKQALRDVTKWLRASSEAGDFLEIMPAIQIEAAA